MTDGLWPGFPMQDRPFYAFYKFVAGQCENGPATGYAFVSGYFPVIV